jgi:hypothetical protein
MSDVEMVPSREEDMKRLMTMLLGTALAFGTVAFAQEKAATPPSATTTAKPARTKAAKPAKARAHKARAAKAPKAKPATVKTHKKTGTAAKL